MQTHTQLHTSSLRVMTAGSVDDGKSTLIGRLMHDLNLITDDQLDDLRAASLRNGRGELDLSLYTDGLSAEREQGITIDVAYRYFRHKDRPYILCDSPGHEQYTRNMVCAASQADLALIMIDARQGPTRQSLRHLRIAQWLKVPKIVFVINKMDMVDYSETRFNELAKNLTMLASAEDLEIIPLVALTGENLISNDHRADRLGWFTGPTLMDILQSATPAIDQLVQNSRLRFNVQMVMRPTGVQLAHDANERNSAHDLHDFRALSGRIDSGTLRVGDAIQVIGSDGERQCSVVSRIHTYGGDLQHAGAGESVSIVLTDDIDASRGDVLCHANESIQLTRSLTTQICWVNQQAAKLGQRVLVKQGTRTVIGKIDAIEARMDLDQGEFIDDASASLALNDIAQIRLSLAVPLQQDAYGDLPRNGSLLILDPLRYDTLGIGII